MGVSACCSMQCAETPLRVERLPDGRRVLLEDLVVRIDGRTITVPAGFTTDYSSIPWLARPLVRWSKVDIAGVVHDYLVRPGSQMRRRDADKIWYLLAQCGEHAANEMQAWLGWLGLRIGAAFS